MSTAFKYQTVCFCFVLKWLVNARTFGEEMEAVWDLIQEIKGKVFIMLDSENDG